MKTYQKNEIDNILEINTDLYKWVKKQNTDTTDLYNFVIGEENKKIKALFNSAPFGVVVIKIEGRVISANPFFCDMLNYSEEELKQKKISDITVKEDYIKEQKIIDNISSNYSSSTQIEKRYYTKDNKIVWCKLIFILFSDNEDNKYGLGFVENITNIKSKDEAIKATEAKFESIFNGINDSVFMHNMTPEGSNKLIEVNEVACKRFGYTRSEFIKLSTPSVVYNYNNNIEKIDNFYIELQQKGKAQIELVHMTKSGEIFPVEVNSSTFIYENQTFILSVVRDISQRIEYDRKLKESKRQISTLIENLPGIAYRCMNDECWTMNFISDAVLEITGYKAEEILNNKVISYNNIILQEDRKYFKSIIEDAIQKCEKFSIKYRIKTKYGKIKWVWEQGCAIYNGDTSVSHIEGYISDITEEHNKEIELIRAKDKAEESDRLKSAFLATMSHELRTPLNSIIGFSQLLDEKTPKEKLNIYSKNILDCGKSLLSIIEDIFDLALLETETLHINNQKFKIHEVFLYNKEFIEDLLIKSGKQDKIKLTYKIESNVTDYFVESDKFKINQVLANLIKNAVKFTEEGNIELGIFSNRNNITFYVRDTGIGIAQRHKDLIFNIFRQVEEINEKKYGGTGIGLTISKMIAKALGGDLTLESKENEGSTFFFTFPVTYSESMLEKVKEEKIDLSNIKILIVEDEEINLFLLESILEECNPTIVKAVNGIEAIIKFNENSDIDIILMDIKMPLLDGYKAVKKIRETDSSIPIVALTAYSYTEEIIKIKECGFNTHISKPYNKNELLYTIKGLV